MVPAESVAPPRPSSIVHFGPFTFDRAYGLLHQGSLEIPLPPRVIGVLDLLVSRAGLIVPKQELIDTVWKDAFVTDTSLAEAISVLRQALGDDPQAPQYIQTVHRRGYRFVAPVAPIAAAPRTIASDEAAPPAADSPLPSISRQLVPWTIAALCLILAAIAVWQYTNRGAPEAAIVRMRIESPSGTVFDSRAPALALSPDGRLLSWSACDSICRLYVRPLDQLDAQPVAGTDGGAAPFFSPDGRWIGFFAAGKLRKVAVGGGMPIALTEASQPFGAVWLPDGHIVFAASEHGGLMRINESGGDAEQLTLPSVGAGEVRHSWPSLAPGGRALLFTIATSPHDEAPARIGLMPLGQRTAWQTIIDNADVAQAVSPDYIAFSRGNEIHAVAFDRARQAIAGADQTLINGVARAQFTVSRSGAVAYAMVATTAPSLTWIPSGSFMSGDLAALLDLTVTAEGSRVAGVNASDVWTGDVSRGTTTRLTHGGTNVSPVWNSNGAKVYFAAATGGAFEAWMGDGSGTLAPKKVLSAAARERHVFPSSISRDEQVMAYTESGGPTRGDVKIINLATGAAVAAIDTPFDETNGTFSPDGKLLAYQSDESGRWEVYVLKLDGRQRVPISSSGGRDPHWAPDGSTLFYRGESLMRVTIDGNGRPISGPLGAPAPDGADIAGVATAGRVLLRRSGESPPARAVLTLEWARDLQRILGPPTTSLPR